MATQSPISTISYNSEAFLREKLECWLKAHIISAYQYICHKGEDGDKDHIHLRIEPNRRLDPMELKEALREYPAGCDKPLGCRPFRPSKEEDWILYAVHEASYLALKYGGAEKGEKLPYEWTDIRVPDDYDMEIAYIRAMAYMKHSSVGMATRLRQGESPLSMVLQGENVYLVNALARAMESNDYMRLAKELSDLREYVDALHKALEDECLKPVVDGTGKVTLQVVGSDPLFLDEDTGEVLVL